MIISLPTMLGETYSLYIEFLVTEEEGEKKASSICFVYFMYLQPFTITTRTYATKKKLTLNEIEARVLHVCRSYDKITADKVKHYIFSYTKGIWKYSHIVHVNAEEYPFS